MPQEPTICDLDRIERFLSERLNEAELSVFESHLDECEDCRRKLESAAADQEVWSGVRESLSTEPELYDEHEPFEGNSDFNDTSILNLLRPTDDDRMLGRLGGYEVVGVVGAGGMGVVLKAFDAPLDRYVAIKILSPHLGSSGAARKRFARESQAAAAVVHDNVIEIYGVSDVEGLPYLVMPYVRGPSLQKRMDEEGPLAVPEILRIGMQAAAGLATAHAQGLVHRDVKPANILLADGVERVKLTDFGLARAADDASLTKTGVIAGTPHYMSPEQARGDAVDARSDLFSLGSVLYAICTGRPPFRAETTYGILRRVTDEQPRPIREINPEIPEWLAGIVETLMAKRPEDRFESAEEVSRILEQCLAHIQQPLGVPLPSSCRPPKSFCRFRRSAIFLATILALIGGLAIRAEWLLEKEPQSKSVSNGQSQSTPSKNTPATLSPKQGEDSDPATAWDTSADETKILNQDLSPFEIRSQNFWDDSTQSREE